MSRFVLCVVSGDAKTLSHQINSTQRDHFFELQFLSALFYQIVPDRATTVVNTLDLEYFFTEIW